MQLVEPCSSSSLLRPHHYHQPMKSSGTPVSLVTKCAMCNTASSNADMETAMLLPSASQPQPPYYLCTITCCESAGCVKASAAAALDLIVATASAPSYQQQQPQQQPLTRSIICRTSPSNCPICIKLRQVAATSGQPPPPPLLPEVNVYSAPALSMRDVARRVGQLSQSMPNSPIPPNSRPQSQQQQQQQPKRVTPTVATPTPISSELSSDNSPPINKSNLTPTYTDYTTDAHSSTTPTNFERANLGATTTATSTAHKDTIMYGSDYQFYYEGADSHGFFRKAVPALPIPVAVLFCIFNLLLPGSGTLFASISIIMGTQTEYGGRHTYRAFLICFMSAWLQFTTAIFVFGWVWSIMWGIVFIKNSLRYGTRRDIYTMSLC